VSKELRDWDYLDHVLEAIGRIARYVDGKMESQFQQDEMLQDAVPRNLAIIGEAASRLSRGFLSTHPEVPWRDVVGMRNRPIHGYLNVNLGIVWRVIEKDLPELKAQVEALLQRRER
jgi:uncharacterized protein with HEPN domain